MTQDSHSKQKEYDEAWDFNGNPDNDKVKSGNGILLIPLLALILVGSGVAAYFLFFPEMDQSKIISEVVPQDIKEKLPEVVQDVVTEIETRDINPSAEEIERAKQEVFASTPVGMMKSPSKEFYYRITLHTGGSIVTESAVLEGEEIYYIDKSGLKVTIGMDKVESVTRVKR